MGPLVPDLIGNELNFIVALVIGIFFGAILEQAGFSTSKKLVGLFYGYDFTVLRVFFTAGIVAMIGILAFDHFGLLDVSLIYINPTFIWSAVIGGLIMGLGFVVGGFCPGTSVCAAAIGKIDAMIFVAGSFIGVFIFAEGYPLFEDFYKAGYWGNVQIFDTLGMSKSLFAFILAVVAISAFVVTSMIENKVNKNSQQKIKFTPHYAGLLAVGILIAFSAFVLPDRKSTLLDKVEDKKFVQSYNLETMDVDELAYRIMENDNKLHIIDFSAPKDYAQFNLPKSYSFNIDNLFEKEPNKILSLRGKINVFAAPDEETGRKMAFIANELGYNNIRILKGGLNEFKKQIINFDPQASVGQIGKDTFRFREKANKQIPVLIQQNKGTGVVKKETKRVIGGC